MEERQVTLGADTRPLSDPFMVLATQNPIEQEGTYPLPEAQLDRFMLKVIVSYPTRIEEREIMDRMAGEVLASPNPVINSNDIQRARKAVNNVYVDERIKNYILDLIFATRDPGANGLKNLDTMIEFGASPRATIFLIRATKAFAFLRGRGYVTPDDVKSVAPDILRHRLVVSFEAEAENITSENIVDQLLRRIPVP
jgi:MoxR-like ATPase